MKEIILSKGNTALVSDCDYDKLSMYKWYLSNGYAINETRQKMHRLVLNAKDGEIVDHIDRNKLNNQRSNLRLVNKEENVHNQQKRTNTKNNYKGVQYINRLKLYQSRCRIYGNDYYLGLYKSEEAAAYAYNKKASLLSSTILLNKINIHIEDLERMLITDLISLNKADKRSDCKGVYWNKSKQLWEVSLIVNGKRKHLGSSKSEEVAKSIIKNHYKSCFCLLQDN